MVIIKSPCLESDVTGAYRVNKENGSLINPNSSIHYRAHPKSLCSISSHCKLLFSESRYAFKDGNLASVSDKVYLNWLNAVWNTVLSDSRLLLLLHHSKRIFISTWNMTWTWLWTLAEFSNSFDLSYLLTCSNLKPLGLVRQLVDVSFFHTLVFHQREWQHCG